jgi:hypothetical protein
MDRKAAVIPALVLALAGLAAGGGPVTRTWNTDTGEINYQLTAFEPPLKITRQLQSDNGAVNASLQLYRALGTADISTAAAMSNDRERTYAKYERYVERLGMAEFKKMFLSYFVGGASYTHELVIGEHHMLLVEDPADDTIAAQFYVRVEGKYLIDEKPGPERDQLGRLFMAVREGKLKL